MRVALKGGQVVERRTILVLLAGLIRDLASFAGAAGLDLLGQIPIPDPVGLYGRNDLMVQEVRNILAEYQTFASVAGGAKLEEKRRFENSAAAVRSSMSLGEAQGSI